MLKATRIFRRAGGTLRAAAALGAGIHPRTLRAMLDAGELDRVSRGIYRLADVSLISNPDLVVVAHKAPAAVVCLISALAYHGITTQIPHAVDIAVAPGSRTPKLDHPPVRVYRFGGQSLTEGTEKHTIDGTPVRIFSAAKTVADCFKFRNRVGIEVAVEALRSHLRGRGANVDELIRFAEINRVRRVMMPYIEAVL
ncbi:MAG: type IV toxin-antitoxin system AbiEi family antitoxin domain-containing protein [Phycisphaerales bacterium]